MLLATGRIIKAGKSGSIPDHIKPILERLNIKPESWLDTIKSLGEAFTGFIGRPELIEAHTVTFGRQRIRGLKSANKFFKRAV